MRRGFTLLEALITVFLVALVLGSLLTILREGFRVNRLSLTREKALQAAVVGLDRVACELREAVSISSPAANGTSSALQFQKVDPSDVLRLNPGTIPATFDPLGVAYLLDVRYFRDSSGDLVREVSRVGGPVQNHMVLAENLAGLTFARNEPHCCNISFTVDKGQSLQPFSMKVACPCVP